MNEDFVCGDLTSIAKMLSEKELSAEEYVNGRVSRIFIWLGMPTKLKGYRYLREAVKIAVFNMSSLDRMTEDIYKKVAQKFDEGSEKNVCRACSYAVTMANNSGKMANLNKLVGATVYESRHEKPPVGEFIAMISDKIRLEVMRLYKKK